MSGRWVQGLGFRVQVIGLRINDHGLRVWGYECLGDRVYDSSFNRHLPAAQSLHSKEPVAPGIHKSPDNDQLASKPLQVYQLSEVKTTCKYPVLDVYSVLVEPEPLSEAICVLLLLHDDDVHRYILT